MKPRSVNEVARTSFGVTLCKARKGVRMLAERVPLKALSCLGLSLVESRGRYALVPKRADICRVRAVLQ